MNLFLLKNWLKKCIDWWDGSFNLKKMNDFNEKAEFMAFDDNDADDADNDVEDIFLGRVDALLSQLEGQKGKKKLIRFVNVDFCMRNHLNAVKWKKNAKKWLNNNM